MRGGDGAWAAANGEGEVPGIGVVAVEAAAGVLVATGRGVADGSGTGVLVGTGVAVELLDDLLLGAEAPAGGTGVASGSSGSPALAKVI